MTARARTLSLVVFALLIALGLAWFATRSAPDPEAASAPDGAAEIAPDGAEAGLEVAASEPEPARRAELAPEPVPQQAPAPAAPEGAADRVTVRVIGELGDPLEDLGLSRVWVLRSDDEREAFATLRADWIDASRRALQGRLEQEGRVHATGEVEVRPGSLVALMDRQIGCRGLLEVAPDASGQLDLVCDATWRAAFEVRGGDGEPWGPKGVTLAFWGADPEDAMTRWSGPSTDGRGRICVAIGEANAAFRVPSGSVGVEVRMPVQGVQERRVPVQRMAAPGRPLGAPQVLQLPTGGRLVVELLGADGAPTVEDWLRVRAVDVTEEPGAPSESGSSLPGVGSTREGTGIPFGRRFELYVSRMGGRQHGPFAVEGPTSARPTVRTSVVVPPPTLRVRVRLVDREGQPFNGATLFEQVDWGAGGSSHSPRRKVAEGRVELTMDRAPETGREPGALVAAEWSEDFGAPGSWRLTFDPPLESGMHDLGDLAPFEGVLLATGRVVDGAGKPVEGASIDVLQSSGDSSVFMRPAVAVEPTDSEGHFELRGEPELLPAVISAHRQRQRSDAVRIAGGALELELALRPLGFARVRAADGGRRPTIHWTPPGGGLGDGRAHAGHYSLEGIPGLVPGLPIGLYDAHVLGPGGGVDRVIRDVEFTEGTPSEDPRLNPLPAY